VAPEVAEAPQVAVFGEQGRLADGGVHEGVDVADDVAVRQRAVQFQLFAPRVPVAWGAHGAAEGFAHAHEVGAGVAD